MRSSIFRLAAFWEREEGEFLQNLDLQLERLLKPQDNVCGRSCGSLPATGDHQGIKVGSVAAAGALARRLSCRLFLCRFNRWPSGECCTVAICTAKALLDADLVTVH